MRLRIEHTTAFTYEHPISEAYTEMRLQPPETGGQRCLNFALHTEPRGEVFGYADRFGNAVSHFSVLQPHTALQVTAVSEVLTPREFSEALRPLSPLDEFDFLAPTAYAPHTPALHAFARAHQADSPRTTALALMNAIYTQLKYETGVTTVKTTAEEALTLQRGVCQDFAHILLAGCRSLGLAARYVSGYVLSAAADGAATHAWADVYLPDTGWFALDPTHNSPQTDHHVRLATGRDYADVPPTRGVYKGQAEEKLAVKVVVAAL